MFNRILKRNEQYTHSPIPFDDLGTKSAPQQAQSSKSYSSYGWGYDLNSATRYRDLNADEWGLAVAATVNIEASACIRLLSGTVGSMAWQIQERRGKKPVAKSDDVNPSHPLAHAILCVPDELGQDLFALWQYSKSAFGKAYIEKTLNLHHFVGGLFWLDPLYVTVNAPRGIIESFRYSGMERQGELPAWRVAYDRYHHPYSHLDGLAPLEVALTNVNISRAMKTEILSWMRRGMRPSAIISPKGEAGFTPEDAEFAQKYLQDKATGQENAYRPLIAPRDVNVDILTPPRFDHQVELSAQIATEIHKAFRVPKSMTGDADSSRYQANNTEDEWFFNNVIHPECERIAKVVNRELMPYFDKSGQTEFAFVYDDYSFVNETDRIKSEIAERWYNAGIATLDESREYVGLPKVAGGDKFKEPALPSFGGQQLSAPQEPTALPETPPLPAVTESKAVDAANVVDEPADQALKRAVQNDELSELRAWQKFLKRGHTRPFEPIHTKGLTAFYVQSALDDGDEPAYVFEAAKAFVVKAYEDTRQSFADEITKYFLEGQKDVISRQAFGSRLRSALRRWGLIALRDGMQEVGYDPESFSSKELAAFRNWQSEQSGYVGNLTKELFNVGMSETMAQQRVQMWCNMSLEGARQLGILLGKPQQRMKWREGGTLDKCDDCLRLNGQVHTMEEWIKSGWTPTSGKTECKSFNCQCQLVPTDEPKKGNF